MFGLEKNRLESELAAKQMDLEKLKSDYGLLLVDYKNLERKVGKPSKFDKGTEDEGKCKATLEAEIKLTENIFNAINKAWIDNNILHRNLYILYNFTINI